MIYRLKATIKKALLSDILAEYQDREKFLAYCRDCRKYNNRWSCPPLGFDPDKYLSPYKYICLIAVQLFYDEQTIKAADTAEKIQYISLRAAKTVKRQICTLLSAAEKEISHTLSLSSGGCDFCCKCTRTENKACRKPEKMRYSLDAFGMDLGRISEDLLNIKLLWGNGTLPPYHTLIHALLYADTPDEQKLQKMLTAVSGRDFLPSPQ